LSEGNGTIRFGVCSQLLACSSNKTYTWAIRADANETCVENMTKDGNPEYALRPSKTLAYTLVPHTNNLVPMVNYSGLGLPCQGGLQNYSLVVYVKCNKTIPRDSISPKVIVEEPCNYAIVIEASSGCPVFTISMVVSFIQNNILFFAMCFIVFGVALGFFGQSMWKTMVFALVAFTSIMLAVV
jgi:hypothetical protein